MKASQLVEQLRLHAKEQGRVGLGGDILQIILDQAANMIEEQASRIALWSNRSDELVEAVNRHYRHPVRNCDNVADFRDAKMKFLAHNGQGGSNYCRRLCHWLLSPIAERKPET